VAQLRRNVPDCEFSTECQCKTKLDVSDSFLRTQFIRGLVDNSIREKILEAGTLNFDEIMQKALILEASKIDNLQFNTDRAIPTVNKVEKFQKFRNGKTNINYEELGINGMCVRCGRSNHKANECKSNVKKLKCYACGKSGHVRKVSKH